MSEQANRIVGGRNSESQLHSRTSNEHSPTPSISMQQFRWPWQNPEIATSRSIASSSRPHTDNLATAASSFVSLPTALNLPQSYHQHSSPIDTWFDYLQSDVDTSDLCPDRAQLAAVGDIPVYDSEGNARSFQSLYDPEEYSHPRQLIIFIRHFFCGACQAYLQRLTEQLTEQVCFSIPVPTNISIIGCGTPHMITYYRKLAGNCPWPIYAEPTRKLYRKLGMSTTVNLGGKIPEYMNGQSTASWLLGQGVTMKNSVRDSDGLRLRDTMKGGNILQLGGEFLFEDGEVIWCHRMRNMRNHAELSVVKEVLDLEDVAAEAPVVPVAPHSRDWQSIAREFVRETRKREKRLTEPPAMPGVLAEDLRWDFNAGVLPGLEFDFGFTDQTEGEPRVI